jgi:HD-GYP domain-containing protein (c-di-GMP phosphodiesterase class II)
MSKTDTIIEIKDNASIKFDPDIVEAFLQVVDTD